MWYQYYFHSERGRRGLTQNRREITKLLWRMWSPCWQFDDATFEHSVTSFDNPDFVDVVIHSYRHRNLNAAGEPRFAAVERQLAARPRIEVPSIVLYGADDGIARPSADPSADRAMFTMLAARRLVAGAGHFVPREKPDAVATAMLELLSANR
jgi:pimeloyl-ACP methyl ester carboxylesterase